MRKILIGLLVGAALCACQNQKFNVTGHIEGAAGEMLLLEHNGIIHNTAIDSTRIGRDGSYTLRAPRPEYPDFYRLRVGRHAITFAVDSTETITIDAKADRLPADYEVAGSYASEQIKTLRLSVIGLQGKFNTLKGLTDPAGRDSLTAGIEADLDRHKERARRLIMDNPRSTAAYFALYQQVNGHYLFSPFLPEDYPYWAAVATAYHTFMPEYDRSKNLYNFVLEALKEKQNERQQAAINELMQSDLATGYIDIALPDRNGNERRLSECEGAVVLVDFSAYEAAASVDYTFALRELHDKYAPRGFKIYQVSLDRNRLLWEMSTENIPWTCVRDENSHYAQMYNVTQLPTTFLMDRDGTIVARNLKFDELDKEVGRLLKK